MPTQPRKQRTHQSLAPGDLVAGKYRVLEVLGKGWEANVYLVREKKTGIDRTLKIYHPIRDPRDRTVSWSARKLHRLGHCPVLLQYRTQEEVEMDGRHCTVLVADFEHGESLAAFLKRQPGRRLDFFQALHLLRALAEGLEPIHDLGEYHGDIHDENIIVRRAGTGFHVKLLDLLDLGPARSALVRQDVHQMVRVFYDVLGGARHYRHHPPEIKGIVCGLKSSLMDRKFRSAGQLLQYLDTLEWASR